MRKQFIPSLQAFKLFSLSKHFTVVFSLAIHLQHYWLLMTIYIYTSIICVTSQYMSIRKLTWQRNLIPTCKGSSKFRFRLSKYISTLLIFLFFLDTHIYINPLSIVYFYALTLSQWLCEFSNCIEPTNPMIFPESKSVDI